jgi:ADP-ribose pyrophosphatase
MTGREPGTERVTESRVIYSGKKATLRIDTVDLGDGRISTREVVEHPGVSAVVPIDGEGNVVFVRQYRIAVGDITREIPAGVLDPGESPEVGAQRELREETGLRAGKLKPLGPRFFVSPGISTEWIQLFLAQDLSHDPLAPDDDEFIGVEHIPLAEAVAMVDRGEFCDGKTITGVLLAARVLRVSEPRS